MFIKKPFANKSVYILASCGTTLFGDIRFFIFKKQKYKQSLHAQYAFDIGSMCYNIM